jgi:hypothetical protein
VDWVTYSDENLQLRVPKQLRRVRPSRTQPGTRGVLFKGCIDRSRLRSEMVVAVETELTPESVRAHLDSVRATPIKEWMGATWHWHHRGPSVTQAGGIEVKMTQIGPGANTGHAWTVVFPIRSSWIYADIQNAQGGLTWNQFELIGDTIVKSIRLRTSTSESGALPAARHGGAHKPRHTIPAKDRAHLMKALASLPRALVYLREPILSLARQDQDLLGCGEADTTQLTMAIKIETTTRRSPFTVADAQELMRWLNARDDSAGAWTAPIQFAHAFLLGYDAFRLR